mmetsp:Transcript_13499/g.30757  ORF Transcript_13499/g.30757 Transcript_13499/m.30757 type:complete len:138 (-) Transcript_13499:1369-1782(-)
MTFALINAVAHVLSAKAAIAHEYIASLDICLILSIQLFLCAIAPPKKYIGNVGKSCQNTGTPKKKSYPFAKRRTTVTMAPVRMLNQKNPSSDGQSILGLQFFPQANAYMIEKVMRVFKNQVGPQLVVPAGKSSPKKT